MAHQQTLRSCVPGFLSCDRMLMLSQPDRQPTVDSLLEGFHIQGRKLNPEQESYFPNITGFIHGKLHYYNISLPTLESPGDVPEKSLLEAYMSGFNATEMEGRLGKWNWAASDKVAFSVIEKPATTAQRNVNSEMALMHVSSISLHAVALRTKDKTGTD